MHVDRERDWRIQHSCTDQHLDVTKKRTASKGDWKELPAECGFPAKPSEERALRRNDPQCQMLLRGMSNPVGKFSKIMPPLLLFLSFLDAGSAPAFSNSSYPLLILNFYRIGNHTTMFLEIIFQVIANTFWKGCEGVSNKQSE